MNPVKFIRKYVFAMTQQAFSAECGVSQSRISDWESQGRIPTDHQDLIRLKGKAICAERGEEWSDTWFFEVPPEPISHPTIPQTQAQSHAQSA